MRLKRSRAAVLGAALVTLALAACAPPGQPGLPGVAAEYEGTDITNAHVDEVYQAWLDDTQGKDVANRRQVLTIELLRPDLLAKSKELGYPITWSLAKTYADQWITFKGVQGTASDDMIAATQGILALYVLASLDPTLASIKELSDNVAKTAVVSPRSGVYSTDALLSSVQNAMQSAQDQQLGSQFSYTEFQNVSAFADESRSWFDRGQQTSTNS
jgi:hypothetical protein